MQHGNKETIELSMVKVILYMVLCCNIFKGKLSLCSCTSLKFCHLVKSSLFDKLEDIVGKGENVGFQHFLHFPHCVPK